MKPGQKVIVALRKMIASGEFKDGERIAEIPTSEALGVSRMPVRTALRALEQEGLVVKLGARGYAARGPSPSQIADAIEVRGVLEGLAARNAAQKGLDLKLRRQFAKCIAVGAALFEKKEFAEGDLETFYQYNLDFHELLLSASGNGAIGEALRRNNHLPFASATAITLDWKDKTDAFRRLAAGHEQHVEVLRCIERGDADGAEKLMRKHANIIVESPLMAEKISQPDAMEDPLERAERGRRLGRTPL